jgi:methionine synthase I (cobalamin-dependent)
LDESEELDDGNPVEFGQQYRQLLDCLPHLTVLGGCCGTDYRHIEQICHHVMPRRACMAER